MAQREPERERERERDAWITAHTAKTRSEKDREPTQPGTAACKHQSMAWGILKRWWEGEKKSILLQTDPSASEYAALMFLPTEKKEEARRDV